jgi:putative FmdB family regulatory protein
MPIYEYRCSACGFQKEYLQKVSDAPPVTCPECGKESLAKMVTAAGFQLKGSGWYATDFKGSVKTAKAGETAGADTKPESKSDSESGPKSDVKSDVKSDTKSDAKPDAKTEAKASPSPPAPSAT